MTWIPILEDFPLRHTGLFSPSRQLLVANSIAKITQRFRFETVLLVQRENGPEGVGYLLEWYQVFVHRIESFAEQLATQEYRVLTLRLAN